MVKTQRVIDNGAAMDPKKIKNPCASHDLTFPFAFQMTSSYSLGAGSVARDWANDEITSDKESPNSKRLVVVDNPSCDR